MYSQHRQCRGKNSVLLSHQRKSTPKDLGWIWGSHIRQRGSRNLAHFAQSACRDYSCYTDISKQTVRKTDDLSWNVRITNK